MLKRMRWRVILSAMGAITAVLLLLLLALNLWNYSISTQRLDSTLEILMDNETRDQPQDFGDMDIPDDGFFGQHYPELNFMLRFFVVRCDADGSIRSVSRDYVSSVDTEDAENYARTILNKGRSSGYLADYRYLSETDEDETVLVFLNASQELRSMEGTMLISGAVFLLSLLAIFLLLCLFSGRAIAPYLKNIERQKQFITDASHEIKTPLTAIATSADILALEHQEDEWVENIQNQTTRLAKLVSNLVTLSRLDEENPLPEQTDFSLSDAVWEISEPFASLARAKGKRFTQSIQENITIHGDRASIQQMVSILLDNAVKYATPGGEITLSVTRRHRGALIQVSNPCEELDTKNLDRLFDRFYRPDQSRSTASGGTGIGLAIARATAQAHKGDISVHSKNGRDITFRVQL